VELRLGYKYHGPFSIIAGWNWQVNDTLTNEALRITRDNSLDRLGSYDIYGRRALLDFTFKF
jgi:hypothetical protein